jgi:outer membrane protein assembly factor BamB
MTVRTDLWNQFGGNPAGSSCRLVNTTKAGAAKFSIDLPGYTGTSSPVIGPDGTVYVGTQNGWLVAINPAGPALKWSTDVLGRRDLAVQTPAVADSGAIYCVCAFPGIVHDHRTDQSNRGMPSYVVAVGADGSVRWRVPIRTVPDLFGTVTAKNLSAVRVLSGPRGVARIFFVLEYAPILPGVGAGITGPAAVRVLAIVDEHGSWLLFNTYEHEGVFVDASQGFGDDLPLPPKGALPCLDTPVVFGSFPATAPFTIFAPGTKAVYALRWSEAEGAITGAPKFLGIDPNVYPGIYPAPVAFPNNLMIAPTPSTAIVIDSDTFTQYLPKMIPLADVSMIAGGLRQMYFLDRAGKLTAVDSNGSVWKQRKLGQKTVAFPALSGNHVHVSTAAGLQTFTLDLQDVASFSISDPVFTMGISSPAIGADGTVFAAADVPSLGRSVLLGLADGVTRMQVVPIGSGAAVRDHRTKAPAKPAPKTPPRKK